jgi:hypothetical protein
MKETALPRAGSCRDIVRVELSGEGAAYVIDPLGRSRAFAATNHNHKPWRVKVSRVKPSGSGPSATTSLSHVSCNS